MKKMYFFAIKKNYRACNPGDINYIDFISVSCTQPSVKYLRIDLSKFIECLG